MPNDPQHIYIYAFFDSYHFPPMPFDLIVPSQRPLLTCMDRAVERVNVCPHRRHSNLARGPFCSLMCLTKFPMEEKRLPLQPWSQHRGMGPSCFDAGCGGAMGMAGAQRVVGSGEEAANGEAASMLGDQSDRSGGGICGCCGCCGYKEKSVERSERSSSGL